MQIKAHLSVMTSSHWAFKSPSEEKTIQARKGITEDQLPGGKRQGHESSTKHTALK